MKKIMLVEYEIFINQKTKKDLFLLLLKKNLFLVNQNFFII